MRSAQILLVISLCTIGYSQVKTEASKPAVKLASQPSETDGSSRLPVKRVVLYKNGVGYFEHSTQVRGNQDLGIDFTTAQLNDVLKSLTVVDLGDGRISGVRYNSTAPLEERLKALRLPFGEEVTRSDFLSALRGARVEVRRKNDNAVGKLLSVEQEQKTNDSKVTYQATVFSVMTDSGEMKNFELTPAVSVRLAERDLNDEVGRYLNLVGSSRARDLRRMIISAAGSGDRDIFVSYISEVPVWKSTYRIILPEKPGDKPQLQGWAIVDNTIGEDWKDVKLSLIAGAPQSFIQDISQPLYARRPVVALPQSAMLTPQTHEATMVEAAPGPPPPPAVPAAGIVGGVPGAGLGGGAADKFVFRAGGNSNLFGTVTDPSGSVIAGAQIQFQSNSGAIQNATTDANGNFQMWAPPGPGRITVHAEGFNPWTMRNFNVRSGLANQANAQLQLGTTAETVEVEAEPDETDNAVEAKEMAQSIAVAESKDLGDYFEYNLKQSVTIGKNQSALVPILQSRIDAEKVTLWTANANKPALRAIWIKNASGLTLDSGTFNIIDSGTFAGEGLLQTVHPDERRLLSYAADTAVRVTSQSDFKNQPVSRIRLTRGLMFITREQRSKVTYTIRNSDTAARQVVIEHPVREGWKLTSEAKPEETSATHHRFRVAVDPGKTSDLAVEEFHPEESRVVLTDLTGEQVQVLVAENRVTPELQDAFRRVLEQKNRIAGLQAQTGTRQQELEAINRDQGRIRENMKALKGSAEEKELVQRYTRQLNFQEDRLNTLNKEIGDLQGQQSQEQQKLEAMVQQITIDQSF
jgi:hypothetical protein